MRGSKAYAGIKVFNGIIFIVLGALIILQLVRSVGIRIESLSGLVLGAALVALGAYRTAGFVRSRK